MSNLINILKKVVFSSTLLFCFNPNLMAQTPIELTSGTMLTGQNSTTDNYNFTLCGNFYGGSGRQEVIYHITAPPSNVDCASLSVTNLQETWMGVFVYENALPTDNSACFISDENFTSTDELSLTFSMTANTDYYFIVTSDNSNGSTAITNFSILLNAAISPAPFVNMSNASMNIAEGTTLNFFDSGGINCDYNKDEDFTLTICPDAAGVAADKVIQLAFTNFDVNNTCDPFLNLKIYRGSTVVPANEIPIDGTYRNQDFNTDVRIFSAIISGGCMTIDWDAADQDNCQADGWEGNFTLIDNPCTTTLMGDECAAAALLAFGETLASTSECFTGSLSACGIGFNNNGWFKFTSDATTVNIDYQIIGGNACYNGTGGDDDELPNMTTGIQFLLFEGCGAADQVCGTQITTGGIDVANNVFASGTWALTGLTIGQTYYAVFDGFGTDLCNFSVTGATGIAIAPVCEANAGIIRD